MTVLSTATTFTVAAIVSCVLLLSAAALPVAAARALPPKVDWRTKNVVGLVVNQGQCGNAFLFAAVGTIASNSAIVNGNKFIELSYSEFETCIDNGQGCNGGIAGDPFRWLMKEGGVVALLHSEMEIARTVAERGPVLVAVDATSWQTYTGGVLADCIYQQIDHAALVVGYDDTASIPYWIVKNSWGSSWGEAGYIRIAKGTNQCGLASEPLTVLCEKL